MQHLKGMGRLAEPALVRASQIAPSESLRQEAERLIDTLRAGPARPEGLKAEAP